MVSVTFKDSKDKLVNFFAQTFRSVAAAKNAMELDACAYANAHGGIPKWKNLDSEDYLEVKGRTGHCIWQYMDYGKRHGRG